MAKPKPAGAALRRELDHRLENGWCAYCRAPAAPDRPLTREHVIPRAKGGRRKDAGIIVPACRRCNHHRGCGEFVLFLLARPLRISSFLDYLDTLPPECLSQIDLRVIAELYAAIALLSESHACGLGGKDYLQRACRGRRLHRRRYAARRLVGTVKQRLERQRRRSTQPAGPSCLIPAEREGQTHVAVGVSPGVLRAAMVTLLSRICEMPAEWVLREIENLASRKETGAEQDLQRADAADAVAAFALLGEVRYQGQESAALPENSKRRRRWRRRVRVDGRGGRAVRGRAA